MRLSVRPDDVHLIPLACSNGRYRVRRALGLPIDLYDEAASRVLAELAERFGHS